MWDLERVSSSNTNFGSYLPNITTSILDKPVNEKEFKDAFFALKSNKSLAYDKLHVIPRVQNYVNKSFQSIIKNRSFS